MTDTRTYRAFISYSHRDRAWGDWLHKALESYRVPMRLVGSTGREGAVPARLFPIFRDREELPTSADLPAQIRDALEQSDYLIVICSPNAATSRWVNEEILAYERMGRENRILAIIVAGEPNAEDKPPVTGRDGQVLAECFPPALKFRLGADGALSTERIEPIAADARPQGDGKENAKLKLIAGLLGVAYDALKQRDLEAQRRRLRRIAIVSGGTAIAIAGLLLLSVVLLIGSEATRDAALIAQSRFLAQRSQDATASGNGELGMLLALEALPRNIAEPSRPLTIEALGALTQASLGTHLISKLRGHDSTARSVDFSPDGRFVVSAGDDNTARVWNVRTGDQTLLLHHPNVEWAGFTPDGREIVTAAYKKLVQSPVTGRLVPETTSDDKAFRVWSAATGALIAEFGGQGISATRASISPDGRRIAAAMDYAVSIWDIKERREVAQIVRKDVVHDVDFAADGKSVLFADLAGTFSWNFAAGAPALLAQDQGLFGARVSRDGRRIVTAGGDNAARVWSAATRVQTAVLRHDNAVFFAGFSPDGQTIVTASQDGTARLWDAVSGQKLATLDAGNALMGAAFSPDGSLIATASNDGGVWLWTTKVNRPSIVMRGAPNTNGAVLSADDSKIATWNGWLPGTPATAQIWSVRAGRQIAELSGHTSYVSSASFSPDGRFVLTTSQDGTARLWDAATGKAVQTYRHADSVAAADFSPDGTRIATASWDGTGAVWDLARSNIVRLVGHRGRLQTVAFSPTGKFVATGSDDGDARLWSAASGQMLFVLRQGNPVQRVVFSRDGSSLAAASRNGVVNIWDVATGRLLGTARNNGAVWSVAFSHDGRRLLTASTDKTARVWNLTDGALPVVLYGHTKDVGAAAFSPSERLVVTSSLDNSARLWDAATGKQLALFPSDFPVQSAVFSHDESRVMTASQDGSIKLWPLPPRCQKLIDRSLALVGTLHLALTADQRRENFLDAPKADWFRSASSRIRPLFAWLLPTAGDKCV